MINDLPIKSKAFEIQLNEADLALFHKAFQRSSGSFHPIVVAKSFKGMFELFDQLKLNLQGLLHVGQEIEIYSEMQIPGRYSSQTSLERVRSRGKMHFLDFRNSLHAGSDQTPIVSAVSQILITGDLYA